MLALVGTVMSRSPSGNVLLRDGDGVLGTHTVTIKITDAADVRELALAACPVTDQAARAEIDASFAAAWQWAANPCAPMTGIPGVTWTCVEVVVEQVLARSR